MDTASTSSDESVGDHSREERPFFWSLPPDAALLWLAVNSVRLFLTCAWKWLGPARADRASSDTPAAARLGTRLRAARRRLASKGYSSATSDDENTPKQCRPSSKWLAHLERKQGKDAACACDAPKSAQASSRRPPHVSFQADAATHDDGWDSDDEGDDDDLDASWLVEEEAASGGEEAYALFGEEEWAEEINSKWRRCQKMVNDELLALLDLAIVRSPSPLQTVLIVVRSTHRHRANGPHCLAWHALEHLRQHVASQPNRERVCLSMQQSALDVAAKVTNPQVVSLIVALYELGTSPFSLTFLRSLLSSRRWKEVASLAVSLQMERELPVEEVALPLFLQGQGNVAEKFIGDDEETRKRTVLALDRLLAPDIDLHVESCLIGVKRCQLQAKALLKLVERLVKLYKLNSVDFPNLIDSKNLSSIRSLLHRKFTPNSEGNWDELIEAGVQGNLWLQVSLIEALVMEYNDRAAAVNWARRFAVPPESLPDRVLERVPALKEFWSLPEEVNELDEAGADDALKSNDEYYQLPLTLDDITMVDDETSLQHCMDHVLLQGSVVGMDAEWRPTLCAGGHNRLGLLQLAVDSHVYLLDMVALPQCVDLHMLRTLFAELLAGKKVLALGYSFDGDLEMLMSSVSGVREVIQPLCRVVDVRYLAEQVDIALAAASHRSRKNDSKGANGTPAMRHYTGGTGLSGVVNVCLGKPLDKRQQMSDWEKRPLRPAQKVYAALDAHCLISVYKVLCARARKLRINSEPCMQLRNWDKARRAARLKHVQLGEINAKEAVSLGGRYLRPYQLSVITDNMLQGLGRHLRCCGVDVRIATQADNRTTVAQIAVDEDRTILTCGMPYFELRQHVPYGRCMAVPPGRTHEQVIEVFKHFSVVVLPEDIFSRCQTCNGVHYKRISSTDLRTAIEESNIRRSKLSAKPTQNGFTAHSLPLSQDFTSVNTSKDQVKKTAITKDLHRLEGTCFNGHADFSSADGIRAKAEVIVSGVAHENGFLSHPPASPVVSPSSSGIIALGRGLGIDEDGFLVLGNSIRLASATIPPPIFDQVKEFFCCAGCGKVFWQGTHWDRVMRQFSHILQKFSPPE